MLICICQQAPPLHFLALGQLIIPGFYLAVVFVHTVRLVQDPVHLQIVRVEWLLLLNTNTGSDKQFWKCARLFATMSNHLINQKRVTLQDP